MEAVTWTIYDGVMGRGLGMERADSPATGAGEGRLVERLRAGEAAAYEEAVRRYGPRVRAVAWRMVGDEAEDAVQDAFLRLYRYRRRLDPTRSLLPWLYRLTVNVCRKILARRRHAPRAAAMPPEIGEGRAMEPVDARLILEAALDRLAPDERAAVVLRDLEGLSTAETARVLGCREGTVRSRLCRARLKMRDALTRRPEGER